MDDKNLMENLLLLEKGCCDLYMHGTVESSTQNVQGAFRAALTESLTMQSDLYSKMAGKGWYPSTEAPQNQVDNLKQKYSAN